MSKLKSLYFKLNPDNPKHKYIIDFFNTNNHMNKIDLLFALCENFRVWKDTVKHNDN